MKVLWPTLSSFWVYGYNNTTVFTSTLNAASPSIAGFYSLGRGSPRTITAIGCNVTTLSGVPPQYNVSVETLDGSALPSGTPYGGSAVTAVTLSNGWNWYTLSTPATCGIGDYVVARVKAGPTPPDGSNNVTVWTRQPGMTRMGWPAAWEVTATQWNKYAAQPAVAIKFDDGTVQWPGVATSLTSLSLNTATVPNAFGVRFTMPASWKTVGAALFSTNWQSAVSAKVQLRQVSNNAVIADTGVYTGARFGTSGTGLGFLANHMWQSEVTLIANTDYRLVVLPQSASGAVAGCKLTAPDQATANAMLHEGNFTWQYTSSNNGGATWTDDPLSYTPIQLLLSAYATAVQPPPPPPPPPALATASSAAPASIPVIYVQAW